MSEVIWQSETGPQFTRAEFEREKTQRIDALCHALHAVADIVVDNYKTPPRDVILNHLQTVISEQWAP